MTDPRYAITNGALSPSLWRLMAEREESDAKLRAVAGDQYEDLSDEVERRWNRAYGRSNDTGCPMPTRTCVVDGVIRDFALGAYPEVDGGSS